MPRGKVCRACGLKKPLQHFGQAARSNDGRQRICRHCRQTGRLEARARRRAAPPPWVRYERQLVLAVRGSAWFLSWLHRRDGGICHCGQPIDLEHYVELDHIVPLSKGGTSHPSNLRLVHPSCNAPPAGRYPDQPLDQRPAWLRELDGMPELDRQRAIVIRCLVGGAESAPNRWAA